MKFGVCGDPAMGRIAKTAGYDYFEWSVGGLLHPREDEAVFLSALAEMKEANFPCPVVNVFIPGDLKITGAVVNESALEEYVSTTFRRAQVADVEVIVFGSGAARQIPEGFDRAQAFRQLVHFGQMAAAHAEKHRVTLVVEPLNKAETNVLNTVAEGAEFVRAVNHPNLQLLVDGFHWAKDNESVEGIFQNSSLLRHAHIATVDGRRPPRIGDDCALFLQTLKKTGYNQRISIEGQIAHPTEELPAALSIMRAILG